MPLVFPIARDALSALSGTLRARTLAEARALAEEPVSLVSDWLRPDEAQHARLKASLEAGAALGFVQLYEDAKGRPVAAVSYWRPDAARNAPEIAPPAASEEDHTDDLYFDREPKVERRARRRSRKGADPGQMDLFGAKAPIDQTAGPAPAPPGPPAGGGSE